MTVFGVMNSSDLQQPSLRGQCRYHFLVVSQLLAELVNERPCTDKVAVHVRSLMVHNLLVVDSQSCMCMRVEEIKLPLP